MTYPKVDITISDGNLGQVTEIADGVCGIVIADDLTPADDPVISQGDIFVLTSLQDAKDPSVGIDQLDYAYRQVTEFYNEAPVGKKLYVLLVSNATDAHTWDVICDKADDDVWLQKLIDYADGDIKFAGVAVNPTATYEPTYTGSNGFDDLAFGAIVKAQTLAEDYEVLYKPFFTIIEGYGYQGVPTNLEEINTGSANRVGVVIGSSEEADTAGTHDLSAAVGLVLGRIASLPVQRKISRVKDGALAINAGYVPDASKNSEDVKKHNVEEISERGYITIRGFVGKSGYYFADDPLAIGSSSDYNNITNRRVIDKALRIVYDTYVNELNDEIQVNADGSMNAGRVKELQGLIENAINNLMTVSDEISSFSCFINHEQNVLSTGKIEVVCKIVPVGYSKVIEVTLGLDNPAL